MSLPSKMGAREDVPFGEFTVATMWSSYFIYGDLAIVSLALILGSFPSLSPMNCGVSWHATFQSGISSRG
jgi:hypothetical protein